MYNLLGVKIGGGGGAAQPHPFVMQNCVFYNCLVKNRLNKKLQQGLRKKVLWGVSQSDK